MEIVYALFLIYSALAVVKHDIGGFELAYNDKIIVFTAEVSGLFLIGKFGDFAIFEYIEKEKNWISNCDICDIEGWAAESSRLVVHADDYKNATLYLSAVSSITSIPLINVSMITVQFYPLTECLDNCSGHGACLYGYCNCEKEYAGDYCSIPIEQFAVNTVQNLKIQPFKWKFLVSRLSKNTDYIHLEFSDCTRGLHLYLDTSDSIFLLPSINHHHEHIAFPQQKGILSRYYIEEEYLLLSFFCGTHEKCYCNTELELKIHGKHPKEGHGKAVALISSLAVLVFIICTLGAIKVFKIFQSKCNLFEEDQRIISLNNMNLMFPKKNGKPQEGVMVENCVVCMNNIEGNEEMRILGCMHAFHASCIDHWTKVSRVCPMCKRCLIKSETFISRKGERRISRLNTNY